MKLSYELMRPISTFIDWWHQDTNNFYLQVGTVTVTHGDVWFVSHIPMEAFFIITGFDKEQLGLHSSVTRGHSQ